MHHRDDQPDAQANDRPEAEPRHERVGRRLCLGGALLLILVGTLSLTFTCCRAPRRRVGLPPERTTPSFASARNVTVRLAAGIPQFTVTAFGPFRWKSTGDDGWERAGYGGTYTVSEIGGGIVIDGDSIPARSLRLVARESVFKLNGRLYRGYLTISAGEEDGLVAMENLPLEDYVRGVVAAEMPARWPESALRAQAVAARTFALHRAMNTSGRRWLSRLDLAYRGVDGEAWRSDEAVRATRGVFLMWDDKPLPAFFHSTCGGHTVSADSVFGGLDIPPLRGVKCDWCTDSKHYNWESTMDRDALARKLKARGITRIKSLKTTGVDAFGRVEAVLINGEKRIPAAKFRLEAGAGRIKSTNFSVSVDGDDIVFSGHGWGHGVGLCQWGAHGLASKGRSWRQILNHYYPGAAIVQLDDVASR